MPTHSLVRARCQRDDGDNRCLQLNEEQTLHVVRKALFENHFEGIIAHATFGVSSGKVEGTNNKIKTIRRQGYGCPDDDCFFLKIFDASRGTYVRNPKSHKIQD